MTVHDQMFRAAGVPAILEQFKQTVWKIDGATETPICDAIVRWQSAENTARPTGTVVERLVELDLPAAVEVIGQGRTKFKITDPQSCEKVLYAADFLRRRGNVRQSWAVRRVGSFEPSRVGYRSQ